MSQATTAPTETNTASKLTPLAHQIKNVDTDRETRDCPHNCHGTLSLTPADNVICESCRCTPDGVYLPPKIQSRSNGSRRHKGWGKRGENTLPQSRDRYDNSNNVILVGGYEKVYNEEDDIRPRTVDEEYTWDLSTL